MVVALLLVFALLLAIFLVGKQYYSHYIDCSVPVEDIPSLIEENSSEKKQGTVVVLGFSVIGMTTAALLSKLYEKVIIVDEGEPSDNLSIVQSRQGKQPHIYCPKSIEVWEKMFPGFRKELEEVVASTGQLLNLSEFFYDFHGMNISDCASIQSRSLFCLSRGELETVMRKRFALLSNVQLKLGYRLQKGKKDSSSFITKMTNGNELQISGVIVKNIQSNQTETINCDLFINSSGRGGNMFLEEFTDGKTRKIDISSIAVTVTYASFIFKPKPQFVAENGQVEILQEETENGELRKFRAFYKLLIHPIRRGILIKPYSNGNYLFTVDFYGDEKFRTDGSDVKSAILDFFRHDPVTIRNLTTIFSKFQDDAIRVDPFVKDKSVFVDYSNLKVGGVVSLGDSKASLNPIYGQGIVMGIDCSMMLFKYLRGESIRAPNSEQCKTFETKLNGAYLIPWLVCTSIDLMYKFTTFTPDFKSQKLASPFIALLITLMFKAANKSAEATNQLMKLLYMEKDYRKQVVNLKWIFGSVLPAYFTTCKNLKIPTEEEVDAI